MTSDDTTDAPGARNHDDAAHVHPWKISDVVLFPLLAAALIAEWLWPTPTPVHWALSLLPGLAVAVGGFRLINRSKAHLDAAGQPSLPGEATQALITDGPFARSRNPNYLGASIVGLGIALALQSLWIAAGTVLGALILQEWMIRPEERYLAARFGDTYAQYRARTRRWI